MTGAYRRRDPMRLSASLRRNQERKAVHHAPRGPMPCSRVFFSGWSFSFVPKCSPAPLSKSDCGTLGLGSLPTGSTSPISFSFLRSRCVRVGHLCSRFISGGFSLASMNLGLPILSGIEPEMILAFLFSNHENTLNPRD